MRPARYAPCLAVALVVAACASGGVRPGAANAIDSQVYGALLVAQAGIEEAKGLASTADEVLAVNQVIATYNALEASYRLYHHVAITGGSPDTGTLVADVASLVARVGELMVRLKPPGEAEP